MSRDYTEDELDLLTPEERAALLDDESEIPSPSNVDGDIPEDHLKDLELDGDDGDAVDPEKADVADKAKAEATGEDAEKKDDVTDVDANTAADTESKAETDNDPLNIRERETKAAPVLVAEAPADANERLADIAKQKSELADKFDLGEMTAKEYNAQLDALNRDERKIENALFKAEIAGEMNETSAKNAWDRTCEAFLTEHSEYRESKMRWSALNATVIQIADDPKNESMTGLEILQRAHAAVESELGAAQGKKSANSPSKESDKGKEGAKNKEAEIPPNLGKLPAASTTETDTDRFSYLDRLADKDQQRFEAEFGKLSEADRNAYLAKS